MEHPLTILCTPLPAGSSKELEGWRCALEAALEPWLDERQLAHVRRFGRSPNGQAEARDRLRRPPGQRRGHRGIGIAVQQEQSHPAGSA